MSQRIELRALVVRDSRLLFLREGPAAHWELPGGVFEEGAEDVDAAMDSLLRAAGIVSADVAQDFLQTAYVPTGDGHTVVNLYAPAEWSGEPAAPEGGATTWFALDELLFEDVDTGLVAAIHSLMGYGDDDAIGGFGAALPFAPESASAGGGVSDESFARLTEFFEERTRELFVRAEEDVRQPDARRAAGINVLSTLRAGDGDEAAKGLAARAPELADDVIDFALGTVWSHPALDRRTRSLEVIAMLAALGGRPGPLRSHIDGALNHGATPEQVVQTLRMVAVYAGFPAALEAWPIMEEVFRTHGIARPGRPA